MGRERAHALDGVPDTMDPNLFPIRNVAGEKLSLAMMSLGRETGDGLSRDFDPVRDMRHGSVVLYVGRHTGHDMDFEAKIIARSAHLP